MKWLMVNERLPLWVERVLLPGAWDVTIGEDQTVSSHWAQHYYDHGHGNTLADSMDLFHEDLMRTPGFETDYRSTIGPIALAAALPHPLSHELIFPHLKASQKSQAMVTRETSDLGFGYGNVYEQETEVSDLGFGYGQDPGTRGSTGYTYDPEFSAITGDHPEADIYIPDYQIGSDWRTDPAKKRPASTTYTIKEDPVPTNGPLSVTSLDFGYGAGIHAFPSANGVAAPRRARRSARVSVGKNIPRVKTMSKLNKFMHEWRKEIRQIEGRLGGFYGTSRPSRRRRSVGRHRHRVKSFTYRRGGKPVHSHRVKSYRRRR